MPTFIENSNCRGTRPAGIVGLKHNLRSNLTARLLSERHCVRYIVAPNGYGKSSLAYEYAQIVFEFKDVFWIKCDSPCFIRDLDNGSLWELIHEANKDAQLVICDDLPQLDPTRTQAFESFIDELLKFGCELIVCCTPANDSVTSLYMNCIQLRSHDLLLSDDEVEVERMKGLPVKDYDSLGRQWRTPSFVWGDQDNAQIVAGISQEMQPASMKSAMFSMLALGEGDLSDLSRFLAPSAFEDEIPYLAKEYPYLGINFNDRTFQTIELGISDLAKSFGSDIYKFASGFVDGKDSEIAVMLADMLVEYGACGRSAELMRVFGKRESRMKWAARNGWSLTFAPDPLPFMVMIEDCLQKTEKLDSEICTIAAWASYILEDESRALSYCSKAIRMATNNWESRDACSLLIMMVEGVLPSSKNGLKRKGLQNKGDHNADEFSDMPPIEAPLDWNLACELQIAMMEDEASFINCWTNMVTKLEDFPDDLLKARTLMFLGALFLQKLLSVGTLEQIDDGLLDAVDEIANYSIALIDAPGNRDLGWPEYCAIKVIEKYSDRYPFRLTSTFKVSDVATMRRINMLLFDQTGKWRSRAGEEVRKKGEFELTHPDAFRKNAMKASELLALRTSTPTLSIILFGGLCCWIGAQNEGTRVLTREKAKALLAVLALNQGREVSRERLVRTLWPESHFEPANKNLYVVWSYLKRTLTTGNSCPYLLRTQNGFCLEKKFVTCDIDEYDQLCRSLIFGTEDMMLWETMYDKVSNKFSEDLLPSIQGVPSIDSARKMYRDQLVDGLVAASNRLYEQGEITGAVWFAREAKKRDPSREDVYIALMTSQIASEQRGSALTTYFECRKYLSENMGIDPSAKIMDLYRSIIEEEHEF